ncbi:MAG: hypothetical protein P8J32_09200 [bacterium]|nr:hypothetical protein [bacterium]
MEKTPKLMTFDGRQMNLIDVSDQHLCNIVHYSEHIGMSMFMAYYGDQVRAEIQKRLNGEMLPYRPPIQHVDEIQTLQDKGMLREENGVVLVVKDGKIIGEVVGPKSRKI